MAERSGKVFLGRRGVLAATAGGLGAALFAAPARATLFRGLSLAALTHASQRILVGTPFEAHSHWETMGGRRRIVTDTRFNVDDVLAKAASSGSELLIRTLGGTVGDEAALVYGEASLVLNERCVLFLIEEARVQRLMGMAQGHYPLQRDANQLQRLLPSPRVPELIGDTEPAVRLLAGQELNGARRLIQAVLRP